MDRAKDAFLDGERVTQQPVGFVEPLPWHQAAAEHREVRRRAIAVLAVPGPNDLERFAIERFRFDVAARSY